MMNDDMLRNIEYLREKADVSYEEAVTLLERFDGNVMRVLVELERQGRVYGQSHGPVNEPPPAQETAQKKQRSEGKDRAVKMANKVFSYHLVVEKNNEGQKRETVADLSAPYCVGAAIVAPHLAVASVALSFVMGYRVRIRRKKTDVQVPDDVETFVDKTVSNIKKTASSLGETVRGTRGNDDDEGGEITVE